MKDLTEGMGNNRLEYIDVAKGISILLVVMGHVVAMCYEDFLQNKLLLSTKGILFWNFIYSFHMPLFMMVSGYVAFNPIKSYLLKDIFKRVVQYIIPFIVVGTILFLFNDGEDICNYWYLRTLSIFVLGMFLIGKLTKLFFKNKDITNYLQPLFFVVLFYCAVKFIPRSGILDFIIDADHLQLFIYFAIGWLMRQKNVILKLCTSDMVFVVAMIFMFIEVVFQYSIHYITAISGAFIVLKISLLIQNSHLSKKLVACGQYTLEIYLFHFFFLYKASFLGEYFSTIEDVPSAFFLPFAYSLLVSSMIVYACVCIAKIVRRVDVLSFVLLGKLNIFIKKRV